MVEKIRDKIIFLSLISSLLGIFLIYFSSLMLEAQKVRISEINFELEGKKVSTEGRIIKTYRSRKNPNYLLLIISDRNSSIAVPLFSDLINSLRQKGISLSQFSVGKRIFVTGMVSEYRGSLQIIPRKPNDIRLGK